MPVANHAAKRAAQFVRAMPMLIAIAVAGCATMTPPQPWEKGDLARPEMQFDPDPLDTRITQHIYTSKEAATGGYGAGGGGLATAAGRRQRGPRRARWFLLGQRPSRAASRSIRPRWHRCGRPGAV